MRRTKEQAQETRHAILKTACELFTEGDFSQITLNQIAERAGLTKGAIYWHFKNKNDILLRIIKELCRIDEREFFEALVMPDSAEDLSTLYKKVLVRPDSDIRYRIGHKLLREDYKWPEEVRAQANDIIGKSLVHEREMVEGFITRAQNSGRIRSDVPPEKVAVMITTLFNGLRTMQIAERLPEEFHGCLNFVFDSFTKELAPVRI